MGATNDRATTETARTHEAEAKPLDESAEAAAPALDVERSLALGAPPPLDRRYAGQAQPLVARHLLSMQASAGNAATQRIARAPAGGGISNSEAESIARQLEDAMSGLGTDEEAIYGALGGRTANDMRAIRGAYRRLFDDDLDAELRDELTDDELARIAQMMAPVSDESTQSPREQQVAAMERAKVVVEHLIEAMEGLGTEEAEIFNALTGRSEAEIEEIRTQYRIRTGHPLEVDIRDEMSGDELARALSLLGVVADEFTNRVEQDMTEGVTTVVRGRFNYTLTRERLEIDVPVSFQPDEGVTAPISTWQSEIDSVWNQFAVVEPEGRKLPIQFDLRDDSGDSRTIDVVQNANPGTYAPPDRANAGMWYPVMPSTTAPHEFGHLIGLPDEYMRTHADFREVTGEDRTGPANTSSQSEAEIAEDLHDALELDDENKRPVEARKVLRNVGLIAGGVPQQGDFAQDVMTAYDEAYGDLLGDLQDLPAGTKWTLLSVFSYASGTIMGNPQTVGSQSHEHPVMERHLREFVAIVKRTWPRFAWTVGKK